MCSSDLGEHHVHDHRGHHHHEDGEGDADDTGEGDAAAGDEGDADDTGEGDAAAGDEGDADDTGEGDQDDAYLDKLEAIIEQNRPWDPDEEVAQTYHNTYDDEIALGKHFTTQIENRYNALSQQARDELAREKMFEIGRAHV